MSKDTPSENWGERNRSLIIEQLSPYLEKISRRGSEGTAQLYSAAFVGLCGFVEKLPNQILSELKGRGKPVRGKPERQGKARIQSYWKPL
jgi:hypothetical protein